jgi:hypothetical protein
LRSCLRELWWGTRGLSMKVEEMALAMGRAKKRVCASEHAEGVGKGGCRG